MTVKADPCEPAGITTLNPAAPPLGTSTCVARRTQLASFSAGTVTGLVRERPRSSPKSLPGLRVAKRAASTTVSEQSAKPSCAHPLPDRKLPASRTADRTCGAKLLAALVSLELGDKVVTQRASSFLLPAREALATVATLSSCISCYARIDDEGRQTHLLELARKSPIAT